METKNLIEKIEIVYISPDISETLRIVEFHENKENISKYYTQPSYFIQP